MNISFFFSGEGLESAAVKPFVLFRDRVRPELEARRQDLEAMYARVMGRPEIDPVFLSGVTILQMMERLPDRQAIIACQYDARWRVALGIPEDWAGIDPSTLVYFRRRLAKHRLAKVALESKRSQGQVYTLHIKISTMVEKSDELFWREAGSLIKIGFRRKSPLQ